ncbi:MAG: mercury transporter MerT [Acidobacteria bacterium]|nr:mercury transporter MerT [Acidobacteriota bacterium]
MKASIGAIVAAVVASACCIGPVAFAALGSGALAAASTKLDAVRPVFLLLTTALLGAAFYRTYGRRADTCEDGTCAPGANRKARILLWIATAVVALIAAFPYYAEHLF